MFGKITSSGFPQQQQPRKRSYRPWGCCLCPGSPSSQHQWQLCQKQIVSHSTIPKLSKYSLNSDLLFYCHLFCLLIRFRSSAAPFIIKGRVLRRPRLCKAGIFLQHRPVRFLTPPKKHGVCSHHQHLERANSGRSSRFAVAQRTFAPFFDASVNTIRPVNGHTPRKLPARASPRSNLSFHRISSPYIITETSSNCNLYFAVISENFKPFSLLSLYILYKNDRF